MQEVWQDEEGDGEVSGGGDSEFEESGDVCVACMLEDVRACTNAGEEDCEGSGHRVCGCRSIEK